MQAGRVTLMCINHSWRDQLTKSTNEPKENSHLPTQYKVKIKDVKCPWNEFVLISSLIAIRVSGEEKGQYMMCTTSILNVAWYHWYTTFSSNCWGYEWKKWNLYQSSRTFKDLKALKPWQWHLQWSSAFPHVWCVAQGWSTLLRPLHISS